MKVEQPAAAGAFGSVNFSALTEHILATITPHFVDHDEEKSEFDYVDEPRHRLFSISRIENSDNEVRYYLYELSPSGRMVEVNDKGHATAGWDEPLIKTIEAQFGSNELISRLQEAGFDIKKIVFEDTSRGGCPIYHESLLACAEAIAKAITENQRYCSTSGYWPQESTVLDRPIQQPGPLPPNKTPAELMKSKVNELSPEERARLFVVGSDIYTQYIRLNGVTLSPTRKGLKKLSQKLNIPARQLERCITYYLET